MILVTLERLIIKKKNPRKKMSGLKTLLIRKVIRVSQKALATLDRQTRKLRLRIKPKIQVLETLERSSKKNNMNQKLILDMNNVNNKKIVKTVASK